MRSIYIFPASGLVIGVLVCWLAGLTVAQAIWFWVAMFGLFGLGMGTGGSLGYAVTEDAEAELNEARQKLAYYEYAGPAGASSERATAEPTAAQGRYTVSDAVK
jgi:MFS family permease